MILAGERRAKEGHDAVAHDLVHRALVAVYGFHHPLEDGIQQLPGLLGIAVGEELHRALEVGEEHRDLLPLAFESSSGQEDALGQMLWCVALGRGKMGGRGAGYRRSRRMSALGTELRRQGEFVATLRAGPSQRGGTLLTELRPWAVLVLAAGTFHAASTPCGKSGSDAQR